MELAWCYNKPFAKHFEKKAHIFLPSLPLNRFVKNLRNKKVIINTPTERSSKRKPINWYHFLLICSPPLGGPFQKNRRSRFSTWSERILCYYPTESKLCTVVSKVNTNLLHVTGQSKPVLWKLHISQSVLNSGSGKTSMGCQKIRRTGSVQHQDLIMHRVCIVVHVNLL
jgi:hypothetical protein